MSLDVIGTSYHSYPKIYTLGHPALAELFSDEVLIQEKIDGSQISFGVFNGELRIRSKGAHIDPNQGGMFKKGIDSIKARQHLLRDGWTYRGEYLEKPKHNTLPYDRVPKDHIIIFDVNVAEETYLSPHAAREEAESIGLEYAPVHSWCHLNLGDCNLREEIEKLMKEPAILGGAEIEGLVFKNYKKFGPDKKVLMGKYVSEAFKESHKKAWKQANPSKGDVVDFIIADYGIPPRFQKALIHLKEKGLITDAPRDIGLLVKEMQDDLKIECEQEIKEVLFNWAWPKISRGVVKGIPQWYKDILLGHQALNASIRPSGWNGANVDVEGVITHPEAVEALDPV